MFGYNRTTFSCIRCFCFCSDIIFFSTFSRRVFLFQNLRWSYRVNGEMLEQKDTFLARHLTKYLLKRSSPLFLPIRSDNCLPNILGNFIHIYLSSVHIDCQLIYIFISFKLISPFIWFVWTCILYWVE